MGETSQAAPGTTILEERVREAVRLAEIIPERYRKGSFDTLLRLACSRDPRPDIVNGHRLPVPVVALMEQFGIPYSRIGDYFAVTGPGQITPIYKIGGGDGAESQIRLACMHALEHAMHDGSFEFSPNEVRAACRDNGCLDRSDFYANLRKRSALFGPLDGGERVALSPDGKEYLADLLDEMSGRI